jgi:hypothetical protein
MGDASSLHLRHEKDMAEARVSGSGRPLLGRNSDGQLHMANGWPLMGPRSILDRGVEVMSCDEVSNPWRVILYVVGQVGGDLKNETV